jgi:hypothetical protein
VFVRGNLIAAAIGTIVVVVRDIAFVAPAREPRDLSREVFEPVGNRDKILADQIKIVVFEVPV